MKQRISAGAETVRNPEPFSDRSQTITGPGADRSGVIYKSRHSDRPASSTIPTHPMGIIQRRPRALAHPWSNPAEWYEAKRLAHRLQLAIERDVAGCLVREAFEWARRKEEERLCR